MRESPRLALGMSELATQTMQSAQQAVNTLSLGGSVVHVLDLCTATGPLRIVVMTIRRMTRHEFDEL
jgi:hypothetical protein